MGKFKDYVAEVEASRATAQPDGCHERFVIYHFEQADRVAEVIIRLLLNEEKKYVDLGKGRALMFHKAHVPNTEDHLHFMVRGAKVAALDRTGKAHDHSHGYKMQKWALDGVKKHYPDFMVPKDGIIEHLMGKPGMRSLNEDSTGNATLMSSADLILAVRQVKEAIAQERTET